MVTQENRNVALMSINPQYASLILTGEKRVEFRKRRINPRVSHIVIYATSPVKKIIGYFKVKKIEEESPTKLWKRYREIGGIDATIFKKYYSNCIQGVAIEVGKVYSFGDPLPISVLGKSYSPPQSFSYLDSTALEILKNLN